MINIGNTLQQSYFTLDTGVYDATNGEPLISANVLLTDSTGTAIPVNGNIIGRKTDANGRFILPINAINGHVKVSYIGYQTLIAPASEFRYKDIVLTPSMNQLGNIVVKPQKETKKFDWSNVFNKIVGAVANNQKNQPKPPQNPKKDNTIYWVIGGGIVVLLITILLLNKKSI